ISRLRGEDLVLWVVDNGCGFDPKGVDWAADGSHALSMLNKRLKSLYGENYALKIRSGKDRGTIVCLRIPASINR
ncbi:MAG: sensor histidine kinase, partial [Armatimonadota bacterium]